MKHRMVGWYDPAQLARTAASVLVSTLFGRNADYRLVEALAVGRSHKPDVVTAANDEDFWFDYVADVGDGWNSTYAVAYTLALPALQVSFGAEAFDTRRGSVLVLGGDAVYPVASRKQYKARTVGPYEAALRTTCPPHPLVRAVPGNHDWYDSLVAFTRLFSTRPWFGGWQACQPQSYFAVRLPHGWWLLGTDVQLDSDIDEPQIAYFKDIAKLIAPEDRIILCNAEPHWIYAHLYGETDPDYDENNLAFLEDKVLGRKVSVFLAGDLHHYRRHATADGRQKITAGGGGAFLHPTHAGDVRSLKDGYECKASFPTPEESRRIAWRNLQFPKLNPWFGIVPAFAYVLTAWTAMVDLSGFGPREATRALAAAINGALAHPAAIFWALLVFGGFFLFTDTHSKTYRYVAGFLHGLAHLVAVFLIGWFATWLTVQGLGLAFQSTWQLLAAGAVIFAGGWVAGSLIMGVYLLVSVNAFGRHSNEAFSSLKVEDWKSFVRMKIDVNGNLTLYPIGLRRVPRRWAARPSGSEGPEWVPDDGKATPPTLIERPVGVPGSGVHMAPRAAQSVH